jgi:predicted methyltransferase
MIVVELEASHIVATPRIAPRVLACILAGALVSGCGQEKPDTGTPGATEEPVTTQVPAEIEPATVTTAAEPQAAAVPPAIAAAVANADRPAEDVARDADRLPALVLTYFDVHPGEVVFELVAGGGYYTELFSRTVGESGRVIATRLAPERLAGGRLPNVTAADDRDWGLAPDSVDLLFTSLNYHDLINLKVDRPALLQSMLTILKPGGTFGVIDHSAEAQSGTRDVGTLHRVDEAAVASEISAAGFELVDTSELLRHPDDDRTLPVFDSKIRGKTDQFILKFRKP